MTDADAVEIQQLEMKLIVKELSEGIFTLIENKITDVGMIAEDDSGVRVSPLEVTIVMTHRLIDEMRIEIRRMEEILAAAV